jgi:nucleotide-binding universal stress UspA family protein
MVAANKILFPTDFSQTAEFAFTTAQRLARDGDSLLLIVHVVEPTTPAPAATAPQDVPMSANFLAEADEQAEEAARERFKELVPEDDRIRFEHRLLRGIPSVEIPRLADEENVDLIVMGTHGRTGLKRLLMGSVAEQVIRHAACPVLTQRQSSSAFASLDEEEEPQEATS